MRYNNPTLGFKAARELLTRSYGHLTVGQTLMKWGTGDKDTGYNDNIVGDLTDEELSDLINKMAVWEGYYAKK